MNFSMHLPAALIPPAPRETHAVTLSDGATAILRRHGNLDGPRVALSHGNGMAIEAYFPFWRLMLAAYDVVLFDTRNHGQNPPDGVDNHNWDQFQDDFETVRRNIDTLFGARPVAAVFHSMSGISALLQSRAFGERWSPLILVDPADLPAAGPRPGRTPGLPYGGNGGHRPAPARPVRRSGGSGGRAAFAAGVSGAGSRAPTSFSPWRRRGGRRTAGSSPAPKRLEAQIFAANIDPTIWPEVGAMPGDIAVIGADASLQEVQPPALLGRALAEGQSLPYTMIADCTHFLQIERPEAVWEAVEAFLRRFGRAA